MNKTIENTSINKVTENETLGRKYVWELLKLLPSYGYFSIEIREGNTVLDKLQFSRNTEDEKGKKELYRILGNYPQSFGKLDAEFDYGFGFDLRITIWL